MSDNVELSIDRSISLQESITLSDNIYGYVDYSRTLTQTIDISDEDVTAGYYLEVALHEAINLYQLLFGETNHVTSSGVDDSDCPWAMFDYGLPC